MLESVLYAGLMVAYLIWPITMHRRIRDLWAWLGNKNPQGSMQGLAFRELDDVRYDILAPLVAWGAMGVLALWMHDHPVVRTLFAIIAHGLLGSWLWSIQRGQLDYAWLRSRARPSRPSRQLTGLVRFHDGIVWIGRRAASTRAKAL